MSTLNLDVIDAHQNEPVMRSGAKGFLWVPSVGMRLSPEILVLELYREIFFANRTVNQVKTRDLHPDLRDANNNPVFTPAERAVLSSLRGRRRQTKRSRENPFYAPAYPLLSRDSWLRKKGERVIVRLLFEGIFSQHFWPDGSETEKGKQEQHRAVEIMVGAFVGTRRDDIISAALGADMSATDIQAACETLKKLTEPSQTLIQMDMQNHDGLQDDLADRMANDFLSICLHENKVPRLLWIRILMTYLRFALPVWLLAQMRITCLVHRWFIDAIDGKALPDEKIVLKALANRSHKLLSPTLTPTREVYTRIKEYIRCRVELNILFYCLEQLHPHFFSGKVITTQKKGEGMITLADALAKARVSGALLRADPAYGQASGAGIFFARAAERFRAWTDPLNKGQGKNIDEFLRVLYRAERGDEAGGHLLLRGGRGDSAGFRVFPGQLLLQVVALLADTRKREGGNSVVNGGGKLVLQDIETHFAQYGIDFSLAADARPLLINELQGLGLLNGSPDAGSSVAVSCPF